MSKIIGLIKEIREEWMQARRQFDIYMSLQRYIARNRKVQETRKVMYE
jgi:hypothetical protein